MVFPKAIAVLMFVTLVTAKSADLVGDRIVGGSIQSITTRKFQVAVRPKGSICGGSLIKPDWVVTAAHCTHGLFNTDIRVRAGSNFYDRDGVVSKVKYLINHEYYNPNTYDNDISMLKLTTPFTLSSTIGVIGLATQLPVVNSDVMVSGYGTLSSGGSLASSLRSVILQYISRKSCYSSYGITMSNSMICAYADGKDSCQGDSGGPLTSLDKLVGVVSWGYGCADPQYPGVYTSIPYMRRWIADKLSRYSN